MSAIGDFWVCFMVFGSIVANPQSQGKLDGLGANSGSLWSRCVWEQLVGEPLQDVGQFCRNKQEGLLTSFLRMLISTLKQTHFLWSAQQKNS